MGSAVKKVTSPGAVVGAVTGSTMVSGGLDQISGVADKVGSAVGKAAGMYNPLAKVGTPNVNVDTRAVQSAIDGISDINMPANMKAPTITAPTMGPATQVGTVAPISIGADNPYTSAQQNLMSLLQQQASGQGPSVAANQLAAGQEANIAATMAAINSARGGASPALARQGLQTAAEVQGGLAQQAATARLQEQQAAAGLLGTVAGQGRQQDIGMATTDAQIQADLVKAQAQIASQETMAKLSSETQIAVQNGNLQAGFQELQLKYQMAGLSAEQARLQATLDMQKLIAGVDQFNTSQDIAAATAQKQAIMGVLQGAAQAGSTLATGGTSAAAPALAAGAAGETTPQASAPGSQNAYSNMA